MRIPLTISTRWNEDSLNTVRKVMIDRENVSFVVDKPGAYLEP